MGAVRHTRPWWIGLALSVSLLVSSAARATPLGPSHETSPRARNIEDRMSNCLLREAIGVRAAMLMSCGEVLSCLYGDCMAAAESSPLPYVCIGVPVVLISSRTIDDRHTWSWYPLPGNGEATRGVIGQIESTLIWGRGIDDELRRHLAAPNPADRVGGLLGWIEDDQRTAPTECLGAWAERHAVDALIGQLIVDVDDGELEPAWATLQEWLIADMDGDARLQVFERLLNVARRGSDPQLASFIELVYGLLGARIQAWAALRRSGYEGSSGLARRVDRERGLLELVRESPPSLRPRGRPRLGDLERELCGAWTAAREAGVLDAEPVCGRAGPPALTGHCDLRATDQPPAWMLVLLVGLAWLRRRN